MYGIVNQAIQGLVTDNFGEAKWEEIKERSGVEEEHFLGSEIYPDDVTFKLAVAASQVLDQPLESVLNLFGEYWILNTGQKNYRSLMKAGGADLKEFLVHLPNFHSRVMLMYPKIVPPEFKIEEIDEQSLYVHYFSQRDGLTHFMKGLLMGLAKMFSVNAIISIHERKEENNDHDVFKVSW